MDISSILQLALTLLVGALCWFLKRSVSDFDKAIAKLGEKIAAVEARSDEKIEKLQEQLFNFQKDMPLIYTTREDFILTMNRVEDKLNRILYSKGGGSHE